MTDRGDGTRPHYYLDHALHGAVKDVADSHEIEVYEAYELAARLLVTLNDGDGYEARPTDDRLVSVFDELLAGAGEGR